VLKDHQGARRKKRRESNHRSGTSVERIIVWDVEVIERYQNTEEKK